MNLSPGQYYLDDAHHDFDVIIPGVSLRYLTTDEHMAGTSGDLNLAQV